MSRPHVRVWLAQVDERPVGYVISVTHERPENAFKFARRFCEIDQIVVVPAHRRKGIGKALIEQVVQDARARSILELELSSWAFNTEAHRLFQAAGFRPRQLRFGRGTY